VTRNWLPPEPPRTHPGWAIASVVAHAIAIGVLLLVSGKVTHDPTVSYIVLDRAPTGPIVYYDMPYVAGGGGGEGAAVGTGDGRALVPAPPPGTEIEGAGLPPPLVADSAVVSAPSGEGVGTGAGRRRLGAALGDGRVWVRPWDAIAAAIYGAGDLDSVDPGTHKARIDSAITARIMAFLDTLPLDSMATAMPQPWVTEIGGQKWGIDGSWIYLGNLKLPSAILALLPLPQGNYEQAQRAAEMQRVRLDILQAARRAESASDFKKYVEETRKRRDAEREARKNQQTKPDSIKT